MILADGSKPRVDSGNGDHRSHTNVLVWSSKRLNVITVGPTYVSFPWNFKAYDAANPNESEMIGHV